MSQSIVIEEMNFFGVTKIPNLLSIEDVKYFKQDVLNKKKQDLAENDQGRLLTGDYEVVRDLARFGKRYFELLDNNILNKLVDNLLNEKAVLHSYNAIVSFPSKKSNMLGFDFHRDQPYFGDVRTSIVVMIPLVDFCSSNGSTEYLPTSHSFREMPSKEFSKKHFVASEGNAGDAIVVDASTWHRAGVNSSDQPRPIIALKYTLAPFKQQIDFCRSAQQQFSNASERVKQRLGYDVRVCETFEEFREPGHVRKFKSGQYDMTNTYISRN